MHKLSLSDARAYHVELIIIDKGCALKCYKQNVDDELREDPKVVVVQCEHNSLKICLLLCTVEPLESNYITANWESASGLIQHLAPPPMMPRLGRNVVVTVTPCLTCASFPTMQHNGKMISHG